ncbi:ADP-ribosylglycohydrolase family protein [Undibacterium umbellatum]|jgi:ADP-ribosyl-[dinitrogen reductase] hydrolase|uniref:ADP-ribosylglycohydrolase family protein n=1 Tax=Undibacterium umbellatum TaxID=2762300 RepID=A0ABR6Z7U6_9BURK|nr:ADP-ribosylglycohydrolase family protein [Undibacterium umbellatum]MBC3907843.1 ADP-ribosylglycohydrolase family protein [Undibacterium umbellatum]
MIKKPTKIERIEGALIGLLIGDALGVPYEFRDASAIPAAELIEFQPPSGFDRSHRLVPPGTWSDDGAQALCLLASLLECGQFDADDLGRKLVLWYDQGYMAVDGIVFDIGITTGKAIRALRQNSPALEAGARGDHDNGNGSLMRVLPLVLFHRGSDSDLVSIAQLQSQLTHAHLRSQVCCALYCLWARRVLNDVVDPWNEAARVLRTIYTNKPQELEELEWSIRPDDEPIGYGSGYVVDSLRSARMVLQAGNYEAAVRAAIRLGNDTDTTACIAGGIAGIRDGIGGIPSRWKEQLRGQAILRPLLKQLLTLHQA